MRITVAVEHDRTLAGLNLKAISVQLGLLLAHPRVNQGLLRLHHRQRQPIGTPQHIVDITDTRDWDGIPCTSYSMP